MIVNQLGQVVQAQLMDSVTGFNTIVFDIDDLAPGVYFIKNNSSIKQASLASFVKVEK